MIIMNVMESTTIQLAERRNISEGAGKTTVSILGLVLSLPLGGGPYLLYRKIKSAFDEGERRCGRYTINTSARQGCKLKVRIQACDKLIQLGKEMKNPKIVAKAMDKKKVLIAKLRKLELSLGKRGKIVREPNSLTSDA
jgi:hypothetical protein